MATRNLRRARRRRTRLPGLAVPRAGADGRACRGRRVRLLVPAPRGAVRAPERGLWSVPLPATGRPVLCPRRNRVVASVLAGLDRGPRRDGGLAWRPAGVVGARVS